ncbi:MAG TPA: extracellular solute-binding protein [Phycisphaerales bacterium]|nr:extracellular solute-binding protein [Phycisphaerales bacterium]HMP37967.1 extracellular solute-binding protein [Phycisphaerales bacterium]
MFRVVVVLVLALLIGLPLVMRESDGPRAGDARRLVVLSPHNEQIRKEFGAAFRRWHAERFPNEPAVEVVWNTPGGTSDIRRMLVAQHRAALRDGRAPGGNADILFGGGSYEFSELRKPLTEDPASTVLAPIAFDADFLASVYGAENRIGDDLLFDPEGFWFGAALSGFGIVYNRELLRDLGVPEPERWSDLADPRLLGAVSLVNPAQSGSITTAFEAILLRRGWEEGWRILRRIAANARTFSGTSARGPIDVSSGEAAAGICIDFYGRFEAQAVLAAGGGDRVGYIDPAGETRIDADPVAMLRGAPSPDLSRRFVEFVLSTEGQALWQFQSRSAVRARDRSAASADGAGIGASEFDLLGPERFELRRMPIRRDLYTSPEAFRRFVDAVDPYAIATAVAAPDRNVRSFIVPLFSAMAIDEHARLRRAWRAIVEHPSYPTPVPGERPPIVVASDVADPELAEMLRLFDELPAVRAPERAVIDLATTEGRALARRGWLGSAPAWADQGLWPRETAPADELRREFRAFFVERYDRIERHTRRPLRARNLGGRPER